MHVDIDPDLVKIINHQLRKILTTLGWLGIV